MMNKQLLKFLIRRVFGLNLLFMCIALGFAFGEFQLAKTHPLQLVFKHSVVWMIPYSILLVQKLKGTSKRNRFFLYGRNFNKDQVFLSQIVILFVSVTLLIITMVGGKFLITNMGKEQIGLTVSLKNYFLPIAHLIFLNVILNYQWIRSGVTGKKFDSFAMTILFYGLCVLLMPLLLYKQYQLILLLSIGLPFVLMQLLVSLIIHRGMEVGNV